MQAMQSSTASGLAGYSGQFAALRHITRQMNLQQEAMAAARRSVSPVRPRGPIGLVGPAVAEAEEVGISGVAEGAGLAHDAGNLLGALSLYSDLLAMPGVLHEEHRDYASELRMLSDRSWAMIDRLVNHARTGQRAGAKETTVLPNVVDRCRGILSRVAGRTVEISYGVGAFQPVGVPAEAVERILTNLVKNAAEATPWVGAISVRVDGVTGCDGEGLRRWVRMTVQDRGCGMDAAAVRSLMQVGGISPSPAGARRGRGLGFRVVRELVALSGGCLSIESQPEVGTSISAEWYTAAEGEAEGASARMPERETMTVVRGDAGWIAC
jgi:signal transduction histidine kinase